MTINNVGTTGSPPVDDPAMLNPIEPRKKFALPQHLINSDRAVAATMVMGVAPEAVLPEPVMPEAVSATPSESDAPEIPAEAGVDGTASLLESAPSSIEPANSIVQATPAVSSTAATNSGIQLLSAYWQSSNRVHQLATMDRQTKRFRNISVRSVSEAIQRAFPLSSAGVEVYFALAEYLDASSRTAENVYGACGFWVDVDCGKSKFDAGKGYLTEDDAVTALKSFCGNAGLPFPNRIVYSGGGIHAHWVMDKVVAREMWQDFAKKLKALTHRFGFLADDSRTADIASVLRIPGTHNHKYAPPKPVTLEFTSDKLISRSQMLEAIDGAYIKYCGAAKAVATEGNSATGNTENSEMWPPDMERLASALATLDPDCDDATWKLKRLAPMARAAQRFPDLADKLYRLGRSWSSGELCGKPSKAWTTPGASNGLTGEQVFDSVWERFLNAPPSSKQTSLGTIYHEAKEIGWTYTRTSGTDDTEQFEQSVTKAVPLEQTATAVPNPATANTADHGMADQKGQETAGTTINVSNEVARLNERYAFIEKDSSIYRTEYGDFIEPAKFKLQHDNQKINVLSGQNIKSVGLGTAWLSSQYRRQHKSLVIRPGEDIVTHDNCLNEWTGYAIAPIAGDVKPFLRLLVRLVRNRGARRYIQRWLAHLIQRPGSKMFVSIAMWSHIEGVGKNLLFEVIVFIIGAAHATVIGQAELTSSFNDWANHRIFVIGDEVSGNDKRQENDKLKGLITGTTIHINQKYQPDREQPNLLNFVFLSNHHDALFFNDHDRRFFVWEVEAGKLSESQALNFVAWRDSGGLSHLHHFLLHYPLGDFNPKAPAPMTAAKKQMADDNRSDLEAWVADLMASDIAKEFGREVATANEIGRKYAIDTGHIAPSSKAIVGACKRQGAITRSTQVRLADGKKVRPLALTRMSFWKNQPDSNWAAEMAKQLAFLTV